MEKTIYQMCAAGHLLRYRLRSSETLRFFRGYMHPAEGPEFDIAVDDERYALGERMILDRTAGYIEAKLLIALTAQHLLRYNACIIHAVAFAWRGFAWLLTGPSGTGKSTQYALWKQMYGGEAEMICGDMPIVELQPDGTVCVHPSAWNGKECWSGTVSAPLGGVIFLAQAEENSIERLEPMLCGRSLLRRFICIPDTEEEIRVFTSIADRMVSNHPIWLLRNRGDPDSVRLCRQTLEAHLSERSCE